MCVEESEVSLVIAQKVRDEPGSWGEGWVRLR